jgi:hypothetical protein
MPLFNPSTNIQINLLGLDGIDGEDGLSIPGPIGPQGPAGGGGASWTIIEKDLGSLNWRGKFTLIDAVITPTSKVIIQQAPGPYTGKGTRADEAEMDPIWCFAESGSGQAIIYWRTINYVVDVPLEDRRLAPNLTLTKDANSFRNNRQILGKVKGNVKFQYTVA